MALARRRDEAPIFDGAAILLPIIVGGAAALILLAALRAREPMLLARTASTAAMGVAAVVGPWVPHGAMTPDPPMLIQALKARGGTETANDLLHDLLNINADVIVIAESGRRISTWLAERDARRTVAASTSSDRIIAASVP